LIQKLTKLIISLQSDTNKYRSFLIIPFRVLKLKQNFNNHRKTCPRHNTLDTIFTARSLAAIMSQTFCIFRNFFLEYVESIFNYIKLNALLIPQIYFILFGDIFLTLGVYLHFVTNRQLEIGITLSDQLLRKYSNQSPNFFEIILKMKIRFWIHNIFYWLEIYWTLQKTYN
jgi:hypothetical protein